MNRSLHGDCQHRLFAGDRHAAEVTLFRKKSAPPLYGRFLSLNFCLRKHQILEGDIFAEQLGCQNR